MDQQLLDRADPPTNLSTNPPPNELLYLPPNLSCLSLPCRSLPRRYHSSTRRQTAH
jgi:hypothetical protein